VGPYLCCSTLSTTACACRTRHSSRLPWRRQAPARSGARWMLTPCCHHKGGINTSVAPRSGACCQRYSIRCAVTCSASGTPAVATA
tara:strand:- start:118603 stop:118860 length:258 start_codon:yes stop_codon:yes gene_type:complete